jgi:hypothetical protein
MAGVTITDWEDFISNKWSLLYDKIVYRKLYCERPLEILSNLERFVKVINISY